VRPSRCGGGDDDARKHARSLAKRLEQLVAVHRTLLRKYATLELAVSDAEAKIRLRDERIAALEETRSRGPLLALQSDLASFEARLRDALAAADKKQPKSGERTLRGGETPRALPPPPPNNVPTALSGLSDSCGFWRATSLH